MPTELWPAVRQITSPTLYILGGKSTIVSVATQQQLKATIPGCEIVVMAGAPQLTTPCGGCRQRLAEFGTADTPVHVCGPEGLRRTFRLGDLLPAAFDKGHLG